MKSISTKVLSVLLALLMMLPAFAACNTAPTPNETTPSVEQDTLSPSNSETLQNTDQITMPNSDQTLLPNTDQATLPSINGGTEQITLPSPYPGTNSTEQITLPSPYPGLSSSEQVTLPSTNPGSISTEQITLPSAPSFTDSNTDQNTLPSIDISTDNYTDVPEFNTDINGDEGSDNITDNTTDTSTGAITDNNGTTTDAVIDTESAAPSTPNTESAAPSTPDTETSTLPSTEAPTQTDAPATESNSETAAPDVEVDESIINVFINGQYTAEFIRGDLASSYEKTVYNEVRALFKAKTNINPVLKTDFVGVGKELYDGPAILIGETAYQESKDVYKTLKDNQAVAKRVGNKYVIAFSSADAMNKLLETIEGFLKKKATAEEIKITDDWNATAKVTTSYTDNTNFKDSGLAQKIDITSLGLGTAYNAGQGCKTYIKSNATKSTFTSICTAIERAGATRYTGNTIGNNLFATYVTTTQIIHVMFFPNKSQVRTAVDVRGTGNNGFSLPGLSHENKYTKTNESAMIVCDISNSDWPGGMCIIFKLQNGHFFIIDAGIGGKISDGRTYYGSSSGWIYATLAKHAKDPKNIIVDGWLITHVHSDHAGGLYDMALGYHGKKGSAKHTVMPKNVKDYITINQIVYNSPDNLPDCNREHWMGEIIKGFNVKNVVKAHPGQILFYADLTITVFGAQDIMLEDSSKCGDTNEFSIAVRAEFNGRSLLLLGDSDKIPNKQLALIYKESLKSDYLQMAHHGYGDTGDNDVNSYCNPDYAIWVVANADLRSNYNINMNKSINTLKVKTHYKPGTGNLVFNSKWGTSTESRSEMMALIPKCDGTYCGNKSCSVNTSFKDAYT